ncbi:MAG: hypothetical protein ABWX92_14885 [Mycetocola sp.]
MKRHKNGTTTFNSDDIDAAFGFFPQPLRAGMPIAVTTPSGHRKHVALGPDVPRALCGVSTGIDQPGFRRYDLEDERFVRRGWTCSKCRALAGPLGIEVTPW